MSMKSVKGNRSSHTKDGKEVDPLWWDTQYTMDSIFCNYDREGKAILRLTLDELLEQFAPEGTSFFPMVDTPEDPKP